MTARIERCDDMVSKRFKIYLVAGDKDFMRYIHHQKDKYGDGEDIDKDNLITLTFNKYDNLCTENK